MRDIVPLDKLERLRKEQRRQPEADQREPLYAPMLPIEMLTGSVPQQDDTSRGIEIIDFTI
jgi:hypothetical protein